MRINLIRIDALLINSHLRGEGMSLHILRFRDGSHGGSDLGISGIRDDLPSDCLEKLAYPEPPVYRAARPVGKTWFVPMPLSP